MASTDKGDQPKKATANLSLRQQGQQEIMDLLRMAEQSSYPAIRAAAIEIAKEKSRYEQKQGARLSPVLVLVLLTALAIATISACWYAFLYQRAIAYQLSGISILLFIVLAAIILFISGTLSQSNLMTVFRLAISDIKAWLQPHGHPAGSDSTSPKK